MGLKKIVFLFSGFGTQFDLMGKQLYFSDESFKHHMDKIDKYALDVSGRSVVDTIYRDTDVRVENDLFVSLSMLYMVQYSLAMTYIDKGIVPDELMGFSLGETIAASVSSILEPSQIISFFFSEAKVIASDSFQTETLFIYKSERYVHMHPEIFKDAQVICNYSSSHSIISIPKEKCVFLYDQLNENGIINYKMPINIPFHTRWIDSIQDRLFPLFEQLSLHKAKIPVISTLADYDKIQLSAEYLWDVISKPICFSEKLRAISDDERIYVDCSPASACSNYVKYNNIHNKCFSSPFYKKSHYHNIDLLQLINDIKSYQGKE